MTYREYFAKYMVGTEPRAAMETGDGALIVYRPNFPGAGYLVGQCLDPEVKLEDFNVPF